MTNAEIIINISDEAWEQKITNVVELSVEVLNTIAELTGYFEDISEKPLIISLALSNDAEIQELNKEFRDQDKPTNVLSFAAIDDDDFEDNLETLDEIEFGDIIIALETMEKEAEEAGIPLEHHFAHLLTHGIFHLLGFDHNDDDDAEEMESLEAEVLEELGIENPYT